MTTRRKIKPRAYDYMTGFKIVTDVLEAMGESTHLSPTESSMVDHAVELAAEQGCSNEQAVEVMKEVAAYIKRTRGETLFPVYDERDNMGDDCGTIPCALDDARKAVA